MANKCKSFFSAACRTTGTPQRIAKKAVWGKESKGEYWIGNESKTIGGHCIWCARATAVLERRIPKEYWIPKKIKKGALSKQLGIPESQYIPMGLLEDIKEAPIGTVLMNRYSVGKDRITVTRLLKQRATMTHTLKRMGRRR